MISLEQNFFHLSPAWPQFHQIDRHFLYESQRCNHIPEKKYLIFKDIAANTMRKYGKRLENLQECFDPWKFTSETLDLYNKTSVKDF